MADSTTVQDDDLSAFLETFPTYLLHKQPESASQLWVFRSRNEGSQNDSSSADRGTPTIYETIKSLFSSSITEDLEPVILQFWAPVTSGGRRLLSTSGHPFAVNDLFKEDLKQYRLRSVDYQFNIDVNKPDIEHEDPMIISGAPATAFLNHLSEVVLNEAKVHQGSPLVRYASKCELFTSVMLPICSPSQCSCIGVVEGSFSGSDSVSEFLSGMKRALEEEGLCMFHVQEHIPYKTIYGLKPAKDEIEEALKIVCESHLLSLAQVWISSEDTRKKRRLALKLTGYCDYKAYGDDRDFDILQRILKEYYDACDMVPHKMGEENFLVGETLEDYKPRYCKTMYEPSYYVTLRPYLEDCGIENSYLAICLRSIDTGDFDYAFEFMWLHCSKYVILLEAILLTLKRCLPSFKFASGVELGDELHVIAANNSTENEFENFKIFQGKRLSPIPEALEKGKKPMVENCNSPSKAKCKTAPKLKYLTRQVVEQQFGRTMTEAAKNLNVCRSSLKRKCIELEIWEWPGPNFEKRKSNDSYNIQSDTNEEDNRIIQDPSAVNINDNTLTIKAEYADDMIKFSLCISQATFVTLEKEIGNKFKLTPGTYKLKYRDEDRDLILLTSDQDMSYCIKNLRNLGRPVLLYVLPSTQPISGPTFAYEQ